MRTATIDMGNDYFGKYCFLLSSRGSAHLSIWNDTFVNDLEELKFDVLPKIKKSLSIIDEEHVICLLEDLTEFSNSNAVHFYYNYHETTVYRILCSAEENPIDKVYKTFLIKIQELRAKGPAGCIVSDEVEMAWNEAVVEKDGDKVWKNIVDLFN